MGDEVILKLNGYEQRLMVNGLVEFKNDLHESDRPTEDVDDLILKVIDAPPAKHKRRRDREER